MTGEPAKVEYPPLSSEVSVLRALRASWIDEDGEILTVAFRRRDEPQDMKGLSVGIASAWDLDAFALSALQNCRGVISLNVGRIREIEGLDVVQDTSNHANIGGVPRFNNDPEQAEKIAVQLVDRSTLVWERKRRTT